MQEQERITRFEQAVLPHLGAAYNLARWLTRDNQDAEDVVQDAYLRAFRFFDGFHGGDSKAWLLAIVRNTSYTWLQQRRGLTSARPFDEDLPGMARDDLNPEYLVLQNANQQLLREALEDLPAEYREVVVLRELEGLSYKEISAVIALPLGTVMSRLARGRKRLQQYLTTRLEKED